MYRIAHGLPWIASSYLIPNAEPEAMVLNSIFSLDPSMWTEISLAHVIWTESK